MLVAIAGASGKVGRRLIAHLHRHHIPYVALLRSRASLAALPTDTPYRLVQLETGYGLPEALRDVTHLVNLTGQVDTSASERTLYEANVVPTSHLLTAFAESGARSSRRHIKKPAITPRPDLRRFIHISSIAVYGKRHTGPVNENSLRHPDGAYARTKLEGERQALSAASRLKVVVLQPAIIYGPTFTAGFHPMLRQLEKGSSALIGDGANHLPFIHVDDVVTAIHAALTADVPSGSVFLLCSDDCPTQEQALRAGAKLLGVSAPTRHISPVLASALASLSTFLRRLQNKPASITPEMVEQLSSDRVYDTSRAKRQLHWRPAISFKTGVGQVVDEYKEIKKHHLST